MVVYIPKHILSANLMGGYGAAAPPRSELSREAWRAERAQPRRAKLGELSREAWQAERARPRNALGKRTAERAQRRTPLRTLALPMHGGEAKKKRLV